MPRDRITVSPSLIVALHPPPHPREPRKLVGWVPGASNRVLVTRAHAILLAELASGRARWDPAAAVLDEATWDAGVKILVRAGLCTSGDTGSGRFAPFGSEVERPLGDVEPSSRPIPSRLWLPWNFAMRPGPSGLVAFSVPCRRYLLLPPEAVAVLVSFANPMDPDTLFAGDMPHARAWVEIFLARGLLVPAEADPGERVVSTRLADVRGACVEERRRLPEEVVRISAALSAARPRPPAPRTPVYFVSTTTDLEARSQLPLGLGMVMAHVRAHEGALSDAYHFVPEILLTPAAVREAVLRHGPGIVMFSDYVWTLEAHLAISKALKDASREIVTVHGGPSVPAYEGEAVRFLEQHGHVDVAVHGEGEVTAVEILKALAPFRGRPAAGLHALHDVEGITFRDPSREAPIQNTPARARAADVNAFPSAYLTGSFDGCGKDDVVMAILETNRGCPYGCTFCDWGMGTLQKIRTFALDRVRGEIEWIGAHHVSVVFCADANFGIFERDVEIAKMVADARRRHGFPRQFLVNYAKNATARVAEIVRILRDADVAAEAILAMQTTDATTLSIVRRSNIKPGRYDELLDAFRELKLPVSTDLLIGLPGSTLDSFANDLQHCIDRGVSAKVYATRVLVNSPMADPAYRERYRIETDENDEVVSTFSFTERDLRSMKRLNDAYRLYETSGVLFYVLRYMQWDHEIQAADFLRHLVGVLDRDPGAYPALAWVDRYSPYNLNVGGWRPFYEEVARYLDEQYGIGPSSALETVLRVQEAVLREPGRSFPERVSLAHDFDAWWQAHGRGTSPGRVSAPLHAYPPAEISVDDPDGLCRLDLTRQRQYDYHFVRWELRSPLRAADSVAFFLDAS